MRLLGTESSGKKVVEMFHDIASKYDVIIDDTHMRNWHSIWKWAEACSEAGASTLIVSRSGISNKGNRYFFEYEKGKFREIVSCYLNENDIEKAMEYYPSVGFAIQMNRIRDLLTPVFMRMDRKSLSILALTAIMTLDGLKSVARIYDVYHEVFPWEVAKSSFYLVIDKLIKNGIIWAKYYKERVVNRVIAGDLAMKVFESKFPEGYKYLLKNL